jgi:hypothetical protein
MGWSKLVDLALGDEEKADLGMPIAVADREGPEYPYGLRITLTDAELEKLGLDADCDVGDVIYLAAFATVASVSQNKRADGTACCRIELQIEKLAVENEMTEVEDDEDAEAA